MGGVCGWNGCEMRGGGGTVAAMCVPLINCLLNALTFVISFPPSSGSFPGAAGVQERARDHRGAEGQLAPLCGRTHTRTHHTRYSRTPPPPPPP